MVSEEDNTKRSVTFTKEAADQTLIVTVEQELAKQKYKNFSDLCKQALRQFFLLSKHVQSTSPVEQMEEQFAELNLKFAELEQKVLAKDTDHLERIENQLHQLNQPSQAGHMKEQLTQMYLKFDELEQSLLVKYTSQLERIENQLYQLTQPVNIKQIEQQLADLEQKLLVKDTSQLERIENQLHQLIQQIQHLVTQQPQHLEAKVYKQTPTASELEVVSGASSREIDPVLSRLSPLFEDF